MFAMLTKYTSIKAGKSLKIKNDGRAISYPNGDCKPQLVRPNGVRWLAE
jgi:hypothetical protein